MSQPDAKTEAGTPAYGATHAQDIPVVQEPARLGPIQRLIGTLFSPGETFEDINRKPTWIAPLLIAVVATVSFSLFYDWKVKPDYLNITRQQMKARAQKTGGEMPPEDIVQKAASVSSVVNWAAAILVPVVAVFFIAGVFALGLMLLQAKTTFKKILSVVGWTTCSVGLVSAVVMTASVLVRDVESLKDVPWYYASRYTATNLAAALSSDASDVVKAVAGAVDVFSIWRLFLLTIGFTAIAGSRKIIRGKIGALVVGLWLVGVLVGVGFAAIGFGG